MAGQSHEYFAALRREALSLARTKVEKRRAWDLELRWSLARRESRQVNGDRGFFEQQDIRMQEEAYEEERNAGDFHPENYFIWRHGNSTPVGGGG
jgi:hypothetical protein